MRKGTKLLLVSVAVGVGLLGQVRLAATRLTTGGMPTISDLIRTGNVSNAAQLLKSEYSFDKRGGLLALRQFATLVLRQGLKESDPYERCYAATALAAYDDWSGRKVILQGLNSPNQLIQKAVLEGLAQAGNRESIWILEQFYHSGGPIERTFACKLWSKSGTQPLRRSSSRRRRTQTPAMHSGRRLASATSMATLRWPAYTYCLANRRIR